MADYGVCAVKNFLDLTDRFPQISKLAINRFVELVALGTLSGSTGVLSMN